MKSELHALHSNFLKSFLSRSMYDVDGGGYIDLGEMTKLLQSIFTMMGPGATKREPPAVTARAIFRRMDLDIDGMVTRDEFLQTCLADQKLIELLTPKET